MIAKLQQNRRLRDEKQRSAVHVCAVRGGKRIHGMHNDADPHILGHSRLDGEGVGHDPLCNVANKESLGL